jgi:hypothetical protein
MSAAGSALSSPTGNYFFAFWKVLSAGEAAAAEITFAGKDANAGCSMSLYTSATSASFINSTATTSDAATTLSFAGVAPSGNSRGFVLVMADRDTASVTPTTTGNVFTSRLASSITFFRFYVMDMLSGYTNTTTDVSGFTSGAPQGGHLIELTA